MRNGRGRATRIPTHAHAVCLWAGGPAGVTELALILRANNFQPSAAVVLGKELRAMRSLVELDLSENDFGDDMLAKVLEACAVCCPPSRRRGSSLRGV